LAQPSALTLGRRVIVAGCPARRPRHSLRDHAGRAAGATTTIDEKEPTMGLDDLVNQAKDLLGQGEKKAQDAAGAAAAGDNQAAAADAGAAAGLIDKAKELLTDDRIDQVAGAIKDRTPDNIDTVVDQVAEKAKQFND
jgi:hypothetical protein